MAHLLERFHERIEIARVGIGEQRSELLPMCCDKLLQRRERVLRLDEVKLRQIGCIEKRV